VPTTAGDEVAYYQYGNLYKGIVEYCAPKGFNIKRVVNNTDTFRTRPSCAVIRLGGPPVEPAVPNAMVLVVALRHYASGETRRYDKDKRQMVPDNGYTAMEALERYEQGTA